jgi:hypothetical protein
VAPLGGKFLFQYTDRHIPTQVLSYSGLVLKSEVFGYKVTFTLIPILL